MRAVGDNLDVRTFRGAWSLAGLVAGAAGLATSYFVAMAMTIRESPVVAVAKLVIRLTPGWLAHYLIEQVGSLDKPLLLLGIFVVLGLVFAWAGRLARRVWWAPTIVYGALADGRRGRGVRPTRVEQRRPRPGSGRLRDLAGRPVAPHRAAAPLGRGGRARAGPARGRRPRAGARRGPHPAQLPDSGRDPRGRRRGARRRRARGRPRPPPRGGVAAAAPADRRHRAAGAEGGPDRARGGHALADVELDFYRIDTAIVVPAIEPTKWSLRIHGKVDREITLTYARPGGPGADRGVGHAQLRLQRGRGRPDRQRVVERRPARRHPGRGRPARRRGRRAADLGRRVELRHAPGRAHRRPQRDARGRDERRRRCRSSTASRSGRSCRGCTATSRRASGWSRWRSRASTRSRRTGPSGAGASRAR